jgi:hypothetical protein
MIPRQKLHQLLDGLHDQEADTARQLMGFGLALGPSGATVFHHFLDRVVLFGLGRLLQWLLEHIGLPQSETDSIHTLSRWYEISLFCSFAVFSMVDIFRIKFLAEIKLKKGSG